MKRNTALLVIGCLVSIVLTVVSCKATTTTPTTSTTATSTTKTTASTSTPTTVTPTPSPGAEMIRNSAGKLVEKPQYGGTIRYRVLAYQARHFDPLYWDANNLLSVIMDRSITAPWEKGLSGTGELALDYSYYPQKVYRGEVIESYEVLDIYTVRYKVRPGIKYWNKAPVNGRELTADDYIWTWLRNVTDPKSQTWHRADASSAMATWTSNFGDVDKGIIPKQRVETYLTGLKNDFKPLMDTLYPGLFDRLKGEWAQVYKLFKDKGYSVDDRPLLSTYIRKIDKYTFELNSFAPSVTLWSSMPSTWAIPREVVQQSGHFDDWSTVVGTGPWIPKDYVSDLSITFDKNPNYWQNDPLIPGNKLPYADKLITLVIGDDSTFYAALRTGKIDVGGVSWSQVETFKQNSPQMLNKKSQLTWTHTISVRTDIAPFNDLRVRQAVMLGMDQQAMAKDFYKGNALIYTWPEQPAYTDGYTKPEELPADILELYEYHPDKAKKLLADAGFPTGFKTKLIVYPSQDDQESCQIFKDYMSKIGITVEIEVPEAATYSSMLYGRQYQHMISCWWGNNFPADVLNWAEGGVAASPYNFSNVNDPTAVEVSRLMSRTVDEVERFEKILKTENLRHMRQVYNIILPTPVGSTFWWPWLKGYYGETDLGWVDETGWGEIPKYLWIDTNLKLKMTGSR